MFSTHTQLKLKPTKKKKTPNIFRLTVYSRTSLFLMYNLLEYKQIAIAKINKSTPTYCSLPWFVEHCHPFSFSITLCAYLSLSRAQYSRHYFQCIVYRISFITQNIHIYLHYTFENLLQLALILARGGRNICAQSNSVYVRCASVH